MRDGVFASVVIPLMEGFPGVVTFDNWESISPGQAQLMLDHLKRRRRRG